MSDNLVIEQCQSQSGTEMFPHWERSTLPKFGLFAIMAGYRLIRHEY